MMMGTMLMALSQAWRIPFTRWCSERISTGMSPISSWGRCSRCYASWCRPGRKKGLLVPQRAPPAVGLLPTDATGPEAHSSGDVQGAAGRLAAVERRRLKAASWEAAALGSAAAQAARDSAGKGTWRWATANINSWGSFGKLQHVAHEWEVLLLQETKLGGQALTKGKAAASASGFGGTCWAAADRTAKNGWSGGAAVLWRATVNVVDTKQVWPGRAAGVLIRHRQAGLIAVFSIYGVVGAGGAGGPNEDLHRAVLKASQEWGAPYIAGGDMICTPLEMRDIMESLGEPAVLRCAGRGTCMASNGVARELDYWVHSPALSIVLGGAEIEERTGLHPHKPVSMAVHFCEANTMVDVWSAAKYGSIIAPEWEGERLAAWEAERAAGCRGGPADGCTICGRPVGPRPTL